MQARTAKHFMTTGGKGLTHVPRETKKEIGKKFVSSMCELRLFFANVLIKEREVNSVNRLVYRKVKGNEGVLKFGA